MRLPRRNASVAAPPKYKATLAVAFVFCVSAAGIELAGRGANEEFESHATSS